MTSGAAGGPRASVVIPTLNGGALFEETLAAVLDQEAEFPYEVLVVDSGSSDGTRELAERRGARVIDVVRSEFDHGLTRQRGADSARGAYVAFLTQDSTPADGRWLTNLVAALDRDPAVAGAYSRQLPRPDSDPIAASDLRGWIAGSGRPLVRRIESRDEYRALSPWRRRLFANFDDVASCVRKSVLAEHPFEPAPFGEDLAWSRRVLEAGWAIAYEPSSRVLHCHATSVLGRYRRALQDHRAMRRVFGVDYFEEAFGSSWRRLARGVVEGAAENVGTVRASSLGMLGKLRWSVVGALAELAEGFAYVRASREREIAPTSRGRGRRLLVVTHDFPPEQAGGTAVYTDGLARELATRHDVTVFHRSTRESAPDYALTRGAHDGLSVVSMNLPPRGTKEAVLGLEDARAERIFVRVLEESGAELVHFCYLGSGIPVSFLELAAGRGIPSVVTLQDYWAICPRGQMMNADWELCPKAIPSRCSTCVSGTYMPVSVLLARQRRALDLAAADSLARAAISAPAGHVDSAAIAIEGVQRRWLVAHPPARVTYRIRLAGAARISFHLATAPNTWSREGEGVRFAIRARERGGEAVLFERYLDPKHRDEDRKWISSGVELDDRGEREIELSFETDSGPSGDFRHCTAGWGELELVASGDGRVELLPASTGSRSPLSAGIWLNGPTRVSAEELEARKRSILDGLQTAGRVIAPSAFLRDMFVGHGLDPSKIVVSDYGFEGRSGTATGKARSGPVVFGYLGTWMATKGLHVLVDAFLGLPEGAAELRLHGYAPNANHDEYVRWLTARVAGRRDVVLAGRYEPDRAGDVLAGIDVLVVPSIWHENSPLTIHEAFLAGVPVVTSNIGGMAELVTHGRNGLQFRVGDAAELRAVLARLIDEPELIDRLAAGIPAVKSMAENASELEAIYGELLAARDARSVGR